MLLAYIDIARTINDQVPGINWLDLDKGQLENPDAFNSIIVPGVLIGLADVEWSDLSGGNQQGIGTVSIKTVFVLPAQTHLLDPLLDANLKALELAYDVDQAVRQVRGIATRTNSKEYPSGSFYVVEQTYYGVFKSGPAYNKKRVALHVNPFLYKPTATA